MIRHAFEVKRQTNVLTAGELLAIARHIEMVAPPDASVYVSAGDDQRDGSWFKATISWETPEPEVGLRVSD